MRRPVIKFIFCACALTLAQFVPQWAPRAVSQDNAGAFDRGLLWRIEKPGAAPSHLFGTVHLADKRVTALPDAVRKEFGAAKAFAMEVASDQSSIAILAARMVYMDGRDLPRVAGEGLFRKVVPLAADLGLPAEMARMFKPWAMVLLLEMPQQQMEDVLDFMLHRMATEQGKSLSYLETVDEQVAAFERMSEAEQVALLKLAVETHSESKAQAEKLIQAYLQRDLRLMWQIGEAEVAQHPDLKPIKEVFDRRLLFDRNTRMVERMQPLLRAGAAFVAVGALHLYGDKGLLSLLAREGYRVTRVY
jgi:uncharacterized protein YbaP (TraB family)